MKVLCIKNTGDERIKKYVENPDEVRFPIIKIGEEYIVYGIINFGNKVEYLIADPGYNTPHFFPADQFKIICGSIPAGWMVNLPAESQTQISYPLIGYYEFATDPFHLEKLVDRDKVALSIFRKQIEFYSEQIQPNDFVRLIQDVPEESLQKDTIGIVNLISDGSEPLYEVTFFGEKDKTVIVPRGFIKFEMKNE